MSEQPSTVSATESPTMESKPLSKGPEQSIKPAKDLSQLEQVTNLIRGSDEPPEPPEAATEPEAAPQPQDSGEAPEAPQEAPQPQEGPWTPKALAEQLGTSAKKIYDLQIPLPNGESITLGQLKDAYQDRADFTQETASRELSLSERESALAVAQQQFAALQQEVAPHLSPETVKRLEGQQQAELERQRRMMVQSLPHLADQAAFSQWRSEAVNFLGKYGFQPHEAVIMDHRLVKILDDHMKLQARLKKLAEVKPKEAQPPQATRPQGKMKAPSQRDKLVQRARNGTEADKRQAVSAILKG